MLTFTSIGESILRGLDAVIADSFRTALSAINGNDYTQIPLSITLGTSKNPKAKDTQKVLTPAQRDADSTTDATNTQTEGSEQADAGDSSDSGDEHHHRWFKPSGNATAAKAKSSTSVVVPLRHVTQNNVSSAEVKTAAGAASGDKRSKALIKLAEVGFL